MNQMYHITQDPLRYYFNGDGNWKFEKKFSESAIN